MIGRTVIPHNGVRWSGVPLGESQWVVVEVYYGDPEGVVLSLVKKDLVDSGIETNPEYGAHVYDHDVRFL